ncbi:MAG: hypothetical protein EXX96DRAFT_563499 [Benjaminiella poitrasii]|nr:MAG: hypothetical protein EXX96DRAFT_563499 [Benjaminiella poitrasii]
MTVNIEKAEEIIDYVYLKKTSCKKNSVTQTKLLDQVVQQVKEKQKTIQTYLQTVNIISKRYEEKKRQLEDVIHQLSHREHLLDRSLSKIQHQQKELEYCRGNLERELHCLRQRAEECRERRARREQDYNAVASVPFLSSQSKKRYLKARDKNSETERKISENREMLEKCREHLRLISRTVTTQRAEQSDLSTQKRASIDYIISFQQQLEYLKHGCDFWSNFDTYQAQVVLESAIYLRDLLMDDSNIKERKKKKNSKRSFSDGALLDINEVWVKTFKLACFEYGESELHGNARWNLAALEINFECDLCQISQTGWPRIVKTSANQDKELACEFCHGVSLNKYQQYTDTTTATVPITTTTTTLTTATSTDAVTTTARNSEAYAYDDHMASKSHKPPQCNNSQDGKMKKMFSTLFNLNSNKINPII